MHILIIAGKKEQARQLFDAIGFKNDDVGSNALLAAIWKMGIGAMGTFSKETLRFLLCSLNQIMRLLGKLYRFLI